jgi:L-ascorbate metabolism protein UlaG (beta-lactamase superfamily)
MEDQRVWLRQNVMAEPLINQWYAWAYLVAPATAAMYIANSHLKIMQSYISAPQVHAAALKNPAMRGGPFINYGAEKVPQIKALLDKTAGEQTHMLEFAAGVRQLSELLANEADGTSLEPFYTRTPAPLRGFVELFYDLNNSPSVRFIEGLLYRSRYYDPATQSVSFSLIEQDERPFALSNPQLGGGARLNLQIPFSSGALDELFGMKTSPRCYCDIRETLRVGEADDQLFATFFTAKAPPRARPYDGDGARIRYFGHACVLVESRAVSVLSDPVLSYRYPAETFRYSYDDLPEKINYIVITHSHQDHCMFETLLQLRHKIEHVIVPKNNGGGLVDPSLKFVLQNIGFKDVRELDELETIEFAGGSITGLPFLGEHADMNVRTKLAHLVRVADKSVLFAADSNNVEPMLYEHIHALVGDVDVVFIGMECDGGPLSWLYGPFLNKPILRKFDQSRRLDGSDYEKAIAIVNQLNPKKVFVYAMGLEPWLTYLTSIKYTADSHPIVESRKLVAECRRRGLEAELLDGHKEIL